MIYPEEKVSGAMLSDPEPRKDHAAWGVGLAGASGSGRPVGDAGERISTDRQSSGQEDNVRTGTPTTEADVAVGDADRGTANSGFDQSFERLERNALEVKLYLDSIDQRISRMEPRLEGFRAASDLPSNAEPVEVPVPVTDAGWNPGPSTTERRRRVQGVPVERRRAPFSAASGVAEQARRKSTMTSPGELSSGWLLWIEQHKAWVSGAALALAALVGVLLLGSGRHAGPRVQTGVGDAAGGTVTSGTAVGGGTGSSAGAAFSPTGEMPKGVQNLPRPSAAVPVGPSTIVEQGVAVPLGAGQPGTGFGSAAPVGGLAPANGGSADPVNRSTSVETKATSASPSGPGLGASGPDVAVSGSGGGASSTGAQKAAFVPKGRTAVPLSRRVNVSSGVMAGNLVYSPQPNYPKGFAGLFRMEGEVVMQAIISRNGRVEDLRVLSGHVMLRGSAKDAVRTWRYRPYTVNGNPVEVATIVSVEFHR